MKDEDLIDTAPVVLTEKTCVAFEALDLGVNERGEIVLFPEHPMHSPTLFMSDKGSEILVEEIFHGRTPLPGLGQVPIGLFRFGQPLGVTVTEDMPIKIVIINHGPEPTNVGASLVDTPNESAYHLRKEDLKGRE
jgi:hypothetical protein